MSEPPQKSSQDRPSIGPGMGTTTKGSQKAESIPVSFSVTRRRLSEGHMVMMRRLLRERWPCLKRMASSYPPTLPTLGAVSTLGPRGVPLGQTWDERPAIYWQDREPGPAHCHLVRRAWAKRMRCTGLFRCPGACVKHCHLLVERGR